MDSLISSTVAMNPRLFDALHAPVHSIEYQLYSYYLRWASDKLSRAIQFCWLGLLRLVRVVLDEWHYLLDTAVAHSSDVHSYH